MKIKEGYEHEIDQKEAFFHVLYHWRSILVAALIGAIFFGGMAYLDNKKVPEKPANDGDENLIAYSLQTDNEIYQDLLQSNLEYSKYSVLMNLDTNQEWKACAVYRIVTESAEQSTEVLAKQKKYAEDLAVEYASAIWYKWDEDELSEIYGEKGKQYASELFSGNAIAGSSSFSIQAVGATKEMAEQGLQYLETAIEKYCADKNSDSEPYKLNKLNEFTIRGSDVAAEERKIQIADNIPMFRNAIAGNQTNINNDNKRYEKKSEKTYAVIGFIATGAILAFIYLILFLTSGKMQNKNTIQEQLGIMVFGEFNHSRARHPGKGIDKMIEQWEFRKEKVDKETVIGNICALIEEKTFSEILFTGTLSEAEIQPLVEAIRKKIKPGISIRAEADILNNRRAIEAANQAQAIILVEEKHVSGNKDIRRMAEILTICETPVIGAIIL